MNQRQNATPPPLFAKLMQRLLRGIGMSLGAGWLLLCVALPAVLLPPTSMARALVPLPVGPVLSQTRTHWTTPRIASYSAYTVAPGDELISIASAAGSDATLIRSYNRLRGAPSVGRPLIVPHLTGYTNTLPSEPLLVTRGDPARPLVALTLDAGAGSEPTPAILDALRARGLRVTFFLTGAWIQRNPDLVRQMAADGHEFGNHSFTHADFTLHDDSTLVRELAETERLLYATAGATTRPFFRPPFGAYNSHVLQTSIGQGYLPIYWTLDSLDSVGPPKSPEFLLERMTNTLSPDAMHGAIILAHCGSASTAEALPAILDRFAAMGLEVRPLSEVLGQADNKREGDSQQ
jgi:peptidoglycan/xylan/chitin deacetylase (PgdA/CDA1 family)